MAQGAATRPADRYGTRRPAPARRAVAIGLGAALALGLGGWAAWAAFGSSAATVRWRDGSFTLVDDGRARLGFSVTTAPGTAVVCTVRMFNPGLTEVGRIDVQAGPSSEGTFAVTATVPTYEVASSGTVRACVAR
jgi:Domain of unknown function (DUF4307)